MHDLGKGYQQTVKWVLRYILKTLDFDLVFERDDSLGHYVVRYIDSHYDVDLDKRRSTTGYVFTLTEVPLSQKSTLQSTIALSTIEVKYMAVGGAV